MESHSVFMMRPHNHESGSSVARRPFDSIEGLCTATRKLPRYSTSSSFGTSHSETARMISEGVQTSMAPNTIACMVVMDRSPNSKPQQTKIDSSDFGQRMPRSRLLCDVNSFSRRMPLRFSAMLRCSAYATLLGRRSSIEGTGHLDREIGGQLRSTTLSGEAGRITWRRSRVRGLGHRGRRRELAGAVSSSLTGKLNFRV